MGLTVQMVESQREKNIPGKGDFISYRLTVTDGTTETRGVELFQKKDSVPPEVGKTYENWSVETGDYGPKVKKEPRAGGGFGGRQRDPKESARIVRQHSQEMALRYLDIKARIGKLEDFKPSDLTSLIDWFQRDVENEPAEYGKNKTREPVKDPAQSDVPQPQQGEFQHPKTDLEGTPWAA